MTKPEARVRSYESLVVGEQVTLSREIHEEDVNAFALLSGDYNPLHTDEVYAGTTHFRRRVVHGLLLGALVSQLIGMQLPGRNALLVKELLEFKKPVSIGDTVTVSGMLTRKSNSTKLVEIDITISVGVNLVACGEVIVQVIA